MISFRMANFGSRWWRPAGSMAKYKRGQNLPDLLDAVEIHGADLGQFQRLLQHAQHQSSSHVAGRPGNSQAAAPAEPALGRFISERPPRPFSCVEGIRSGHSSTISPA